MATMTPTSISVSLTNTSGTCWSQSGSTKKYESNLGPTSSDSTYLTVVVTSSDSSICNYNMKGESTSVSSLSYTLPDNCEASSSGDLTYSWKLPSKTVYSVYGGVQKTTTWNCTLTYRYKSSQKTILLSFNSWRFSSSMNDPDYGLITGSAITTSSASIKASGTTSMHIGWKAKNSSHQTAGSTGNISVNIEIQGGTTGRFVFAFLVPTSYSATGSWSGWSFSSIVIAGISGSFISGDYKICYTIPDPSNNF